MNEEEYEMAALKRKNREADNIMLNKSNLVDASALQDIDEGS